MVITQDQGRYTAKNLPPGKYLAQGIGGERESDWTSAADVSAAAPATVNLTLSKRRAAALPNAWPGRKPGEGGGEGGGGDANPKDFPDGPGKQIALTKCAACHPATRIVGFQADRQRWMETMEDMRMYMAEIGRAHV